MTAVNNQWPCDKSQGVQNNNPALSELCPRPAPSDTKSMVGDEYILVRKSVKGLSSSEAVVKTGSELDSKTLNKLSNTKLNGTSNDQMIDQRKMISSSDTKAVMRLPGRMAGMKMRLKPQRLWLPVPFVNTATVTSGVVNTVISVDPSTVTESSSLATLYDECRVHQARVRLNYQNVAAPNPSVDGSMLVVGYDPASATALTSVANGCELSLHKLFGVEFAALGGSTPTMHEGNPYVFDFKVPKGVLLESGFGDGGYVPTGTSVSYGYLKFFHIGNIITAINVGGGIMYLDVEYRSRH
jgi:hypothetical protein